MQDSIEAHIQASLKTAQVPDGGPFPAYPSGKIWDEASGKTSSEKKFYHNVISGDDFAAWPYHVAIIAPVIHYCMAVWKLMRIQQPWDRAQSQFWASTRQKRWQFSSGLHGLRPCGKSLCQVRVKRQNKGHYSCGACR